MKYFNDYQTLKFYVKLTYIYMEFIMIIEKTIYVIESWSYSTNQYRTDIRSLILWQSVLGILQIKARYLINNYII
ncbi:hypothetical protein QTP88_000698 [Uroleucon formosanum]